MSGPVFIVGVQRSGTTLLASMLAANSRLSCGPETHFFRQLAQADVPSLLDRRTWPERATEFLSSIRHTRTLPGTRSTLLEKYDLRPQDVFAYLRTREPAVTHVLESVTVQYMASQGKKRWLEKTPDHLLHVQAIRRYFPDSPIIRIVRDPRDVALSLLRVPWGVRSVLEGLLYWGHLHRTSAPFFATDRLSYTVRFEDLVEAPARELQQICEFIGEAYEEGMLDTSETGARINSRRAPWKDKARHRADPARVAAWRGELAASHARLAEALLGDELRSQGYPVEGAFHRTGEIYPGLEAAAPHSTSLEALALEGLRFWRVHPGEPITDTVYLGEPSAWLRPDRGQISRIRDVLRIALNLTRGRAGLRRIHWISTGNRTPAGGYVSRGIGKALSPYRVEPLPQARPACQPEQAALGLRSE